MSWEISQRRRPNASDVTAEWTSYSTAYDVALVCGPGVARTSFGGSSRAELGPMSKPVRGIFRWEAGTEDPHVVLRWRDEPGGEVRERKVGLGV